ncbi:MAG: FAD-dependent thymidylate synthase [Desulfobulbaceae bacterium]|nr:FAD-dependent thymidylate synthase [Desulfobulbaceae bacterium]
MRVVAPSFEILDELDSQSLAVRIEVCGRICYKSEDKINEASAIPFIKRIVKHGHNSVTEMGALTLKVTIDSETLATQFFAVVPKYFQIDRLDKQVMLITGTVRAFRELYQNHGSVKMVKAITNYLADQNPLFFEDLLPKRGAVPQSGVAVEKVSLAEVDRLSADLVAKHRFLAVKFITNRAVTHEIVRHRPCSFLQESQRYCRYSEDKFGSEVTFIKPMFFEEGSAEYKLWEEAMVETEKLYLKLLETTSPQAARTVLPNSCKTELIVYANFLEWFHIFKLRTTPAAEPSMRELMIPLAQELGRRYPAQFGELSKSLEEVSAQ